MTPEHHTPDGTSPFAGQPKLKPKTDPLAVGDTGSGSGSGKSGPSSARRRGGRPPAPAADDAVALTVRVDPKESDEIDLWLLGLRQEVGTRTRLGKAEVIRDLLVLARTHEPTHRALVRKLKG